ncbi:MAG: hypothetical protein E7430_07050 [Ruminococcaceae bacterium]|nr:hypothetical protein [Oscillospiraceae bacterium]
MMKKLALLLGLVLLLSGCEISRVDAPQNRYVFYYLTAGEADDLNELKIDFEVRHIEANSPLTVLEVYLQGPESGGLTSPFPPMTSVLSYGKSDDVAKIRMSSEFFELTGADKTLAEACLTMTAAELSGASEVQLVDPDGKVSSRDTEMYILKEEIEAVSDDSVTLYFADANGQYLVPESRKLVSGAGVTDERYIIDQLIRGPVGDELSPVMPAGTELLSVMTDINGVCTVDFSGHFMENKPETERQEFITIYAVVNSLSSLDWVESVRILIEGSQTEIYRYMELSDPIRYYDGIVGPVRSGVNEIGINLYMQSWSPDYLAGLPEIIKRRVNVTTEEQLLEMLINFEPPEGFTNPIPFDTEINSVSVTEGDCVVNLTAEFLSVADKDAAAQRLSVLSIAATLSQLEYIDSVLILIDGEKTDLPDYNMSEPITVANDVFFP